MDPNLNTSPTFSFKDILVKKISQAVASSVLSMIAILILYIFLANFSLLHPIEWLTSTLNTFMYLSTWIFVITFICIIFAQSIICAKDYILMSSYCPTRFQQLVRIFSIHNFMLLSLHVLIGGVLVWQILSIVDGNTKGLTQEVAGGKFELVADTYFLILNGLWTGLYFFLRIYVSSKHLSFPAIQQRKFLHFRSSLLPILRDSFSLSLWPTFVFSIFYYFWGPQLELRFASFFSLSGISYSGSILVYLYSWWFSTLYFFSMNLMRFYFYLYLTEKVEFPLFKENANMLTLQDALNLNNFPIIQNLACLDLFLLSQWSPQRRQFFFTLSQPGGHPHNWNALIESVLKLFNEYTDLLKKSTEDPKLQQNKKAMNAPITPTNSLNKTEILSPIYLSPVENNLKFRNLRNMSLCSDYVDVVDISHSTPKIDNLDKLKQTFDEKLSKVTSFIRIILGIDYFFSELPEVNIQRCLGNGHLVIWASQGISEIMTASLTEDQFGVIQKDLPIIVTSLVHLKQNLDKLSKVPALSRKVASLDDFNYKMKNAVSASVKRSLFNICAHFGDYFSDFPLGKDVLQYLQMNIMLKNN